MTMFRGCYDHFLGLLCHFFLQIQDLLCYFYRIQVLSLQFYKSWSLLRPLCCWLANLDSFRCTCLWMLVTCMHLYASGNSTAHYQERVCQFTTLPYLYIFSRSAAVCKCTWIVSDLLSAICSSVPPPSLFAIVQGTGLRTIEASKTGKCKVK